MPQMPHDLEPELLASPPRRVRIRGDLVALLLGLLLVPPLLVGGAIIGIAWWHYHSETADIRALIDHGVQTQAATTDVWFQKAGVGSASSIVCRRYEYTVHGQKFTGEEKGAPMSALSRLPITVTYLSYAPDINRPGIVTSDDLKDAKASFRTGVRAGLSIGGGILAFLGLVFVLPNFLGMWRELYLARYGTPAVASVIEPTKRGARIEFQPPGQPAQTGRISSALHMDTGQRLTIVYDPRKPSRFRAYAKMGSVRFG